MYNDKTGAPEAARPSSPHSSVRPLARNPVHWYCSSNPMYTPTHCNVGILQCSAHHHSTSVRVWRSPTMCWGAAARSRPAAPSAPPVAPAPRVASGAPLVPQQHRAHRSHRSMQASLPRWRAQRLRPLSMQHASSHRDEQQAWCHSHAGGASTAQSRPSFRYAHAGYPCHTDRAPRRRGQHPRPAPGAGASAAPVGLLNSQNGHMLYLPPYPRRPVTKFISANAQHPGGSHEPAHGAEHAALRAPRSKTTLMGPIAPKETRFVAEFGVVGFALINNDQD